MPEFLTPQQLCARWHLSPRQLRPLLGTRVPVWRINARVFRIAVSDVQALEDEARELRRKKSMRELRRVVARTPSHGTPNY
jgi:hypothetical protein